MIRKGLTFAITLILSVPVLAQDNTFGILFGTAEFLESSVSLDFELDVNEIWYSRQIDDGTELRLELGQSDVRVEETDNGPALGDYEVEYASILVEYRFHEVFGSTSLFLGPGAYRIKSDSGDQTDFGIGAGVGGDFPITRRLGFIVEGAYHWVNHDDDFEFLTLGAGLRMSF